MTAPVDLPPAARPRLHCDAYLTAAFLASPLAELLRAVAGLPTVAQVSIMLICTRSNFWSVLANQLRASSMYSFRFGKAVTLE